MNRSRIFWSLAIGVSLVLHIAVVVVLRDRPLGKVDLQRLAQQRDVWQVRRSPDDVIMQFDVNPRQLTGTMPAPPRDMPDLAKMSQALLEDDSAQPAPLATDPGTSVQMRPAPAERKIDDEEETAVAVNLPELLSALMIGPAPGAIAFVPGTTEPDLGTGVVPGTGSEAVRTRALLTDAGLKGGHNPLPPMRRHIVEMDPVDRRMMDAPPATPEIDFSRIALENTTKLDIPEHLDSDFEYRLTTWSDTKAKQAPYAYFRIDITPKRSLRKLHTMPKDVVFVLDVSSSIPQDWVNQTILGIWDSLSQLNPDDRFNIVLFNEKAAALSNKGALKPTQENLNKAEAFLEDTKSQGYTDVNHAISKLLIRDVATERVYDIILLSDGRPTRGVIDTRELINLITKDNDLAASIYSVGIGTQQDKALLNFLAYRNRGFSTFIKDFTDARDQIRKLTSRLRYPIMKEVQLATVGLDSDEVYPLNLPTIHQGESFAIYGTYQRRGRFTMRVSGHNGKKNLDFTNGFNFATAARGDKQVANDWAFWKLHHLYSRIITEGERQIILNQIDQLRKRYKLKTLY